MRFILLLCLAAYYLDEVNGKPAPQTMDQARDLYEAIKEKFQQAMDQATVIAARIYEAAKQALQEGLQSMQQAVNEEIGVSTEFRAVESVPGVA